MADSTTTQRGAGRPRRSRLEIVRANDRAITQATLNAIAERGWDQVAFSDVATRAGLTVGAVYGRAETKAELGNAVWTSSVVEWFRSRLDELLAAAESGEVDALAAAFDRWEGEPLLSAAVGEMLIASLFDDELAEVVGAQSRQILADRLTPVGEGRRAQQTAAAKVLVSSLAFGRLLARRGNPALGPLVPAQVQTLASMAAMPLTRRRLPREPVSFVREVTQGDPQREQIWRAVIDVLGRVGYRRATIARMARAAGMSSGALFAKFEDKAHLVAEAAGALLISPYEMWTQYEHVEAEHGPVISRAMWVTDVLQPHNAPHWATNLELARVAQFEPELGYFTPSPVPHGHVNLGVMMVAAFAPDLSALPYGGPFQAGYTT